MDVILKISKRGNLLDVLFYVENTDEAEKAIKKLNDANDGYVYKYKNINKAETI